MVVVLYFVQGYRKSSHRHYLVVVVASGCLVEIGLHKSTDWLSSSERTPVDLLEQTVFLAEVDDELRPDWGWTLGTAPNLLNHVINLEVFFRQFLLAEASGNVIKVNLPTCYVSTAWGISNSLSPSTCSCSLTFSLSACLALLANLIYDVKCGFITSDLLMKHSKNQGGGRYYLRPLKVTKGERVKAWIFYYYTVLQNYVHTTSLHGYGWHALAGKQVSLFGLVQIYVRSKCSHQRKRRKELLLFDVESWCN